MFAFTLVQKYKHWLENVEPVINTYANHLIVIFAFSVPVLVEVRRTSLVLVIFLFLVRGRMFNKIKNALRDPVVLAFTLYFMVHVIWIAGTDDFSRIGETIHDASFLLIPLLFSTFIDKRFVPRIIGAFIAGMIVSVLVSYGIYFEVIPGMIHDGNQGDWKDPTPFYHHTHYGYMLALTSVILLQKYISTAIKGENGTIWLILMVGVAANIFIIAGRSGFVLLVILMPALYLFTYRKKALKPVLILLVILSVSTVIAYKQSSTFSNRVNTTKDSVEKMIHDNYYTSSLGGRVVITIISLDLASENWLAGMGTADHTGQILEIIRQDYSELLFLTQWLAHPHNEYINALLQFGVLGLIVFLNISFQLMRYKNENKENEIMFKLIGLSILFYVIQDVMIIDLGMLFTVVVLVSGGLRKYSITDAAYVDFNARQGSMYVLSMLVFYLLKQI